jgi:hypothetical protein
MIKKHALRHWAIALVLVVCSSLANGCITKSTSSYPTGVIADSVRGFSGKQGANGWSYGYWDRTADADKNYGQTVDFRLLKHFGGDPINRLSGRREFTIGELWNLQDGLYYTSLWAEGGHPNGTTKQGEYAAVEHWAVRRWVSAADGRVTISGHAGKVMPWGEHWGGGCRALIVVDGETIFSTAMDNRGTDYSIDATVHIGSLVDFLIGPDRSVGVTTFTAIIRSSPTKP